MRNDRPRPDSNRRITDLQSVPLVHLGTRPRFSDNIAVNGSEQVSGRQSSSDSRNCSTDNSMQPQDQHPKAIIGVRQSPPVVTSQSRTRGPTGGPASIPLSAFLD